MQLFLGGLLQPSQVQPSLLNMVSCDRYSHLIAVEKVGNHQVDFGITNRTENAAT